MNFTDNGYSYVTDLTWLKPSYPSEFFEFKSTDAQELKRIEKLMRLAGYTVQSCKNMVIAWKNGEPAKQHKLYEGRES